MTGVKGYALVMVGILVFTATCIYAGELYNNLEAQETTALEADATALMQEIRESEHLVMDGAGAGTFDPDKVMSATADDFEHDGLGYQLEIEDLSPQMGYSRTVGRSNAIQTSAPPAVYDEGELVTVRSAAVIWIGPDEVVQARLTLKVWEVQDGAG